MKNRKILQAGWVFAGLITMAGLAIACSNDSSDELEACGCTYYPEIDQYLPRPLDPDDVKGEDTFYSGDQLRAFNEECRERCQ